MAEFRGKALGFIGLVVGCWAAARMVPAMGPAGDRAGAVSGHSKPQTTTPPTPQSVALQSAEANAPTPLASGSGQHRARPLLFARHPFPAPSPTARPWAAGDPPSGFQPPPWVAATENPLSALEATLPSRALALEGKVGSGEYVELPPAKAKRLSVYAYSFWRAGSGDAALSPNGQYGGSQSALVAGYDLTGRDNRGLGLFARLSATPEGDEKEAAFGLRWLRFAGLPLQLAAERRVRLDGADRFALFAATGIDNKALPAKFKLEGYAQAGWVSGGGGSDFFDAQARVTRAIPSLKAAPIRLGLGAWAGGQSGDYRLDIGPTLITKFDTGLAKLDLRLDWRQRIAGKVRPDSGLALTVSTGF